jgi:hypothetical protein
MTSRRTTNEGKGRASGAANDVKARAASDGTYSCACPKVSSDAEHSAGTVLNPVPTRQWSRCCAVERRLIGSMRVHWLWRVSVVVRARLATVPGPAGMQAKARRRRRPVARLCLRRRRDKIHGSLQTLVSCIRARSVELPVAFMRARHFAIHAVSADFWSELSATCVSA